jgi:hypothetical protein
MTVARAQIAGSTIIVNSASDGFVIVDPWHPQPAPVCTLRDAITAANTNLPVAGCAAGRPSPAVDTILFNIGVGTPVINVRTQLPPVIEPVFINGGSFGATRVELEGSRASFAAALTGHKAHGLFLAAGSSTIRNMVINRFNGDGIVMTTFTGDPPSDFTPPEITDPSIRLTRRAPLLGRWRRRRRGYSYPASHRRRRRQQQGSRLLNRN